jgi:hypothetical protein
MIVLMFVCASAHAQLTQDQAFELGKSVHPDAAANLTYEGVLNTGRAGSLQPYDANSPEHSQYWTGNQSITGPMLQSGANMNVQCLGNNDPANDQQRCEAVRYINQTAEMRAQMDAMIPPGDPLRLVGKTIADNPEAIAGAFGGAYSDCTEQTLTFDGDFAYETCQDSLENGPSSCAIGRNIVVDARHLYSCVRTLKQLYSGQCTVGRVIQVEKFKNYQCKIKPETKNTYTCNRTLVVSCAGGWNCNGAGLEVSSIQSDMTYGLLPTENGVFDFAYGTEGDNYWSGPEKTGTVYDRTLTFNIRNKAMLQEFLLTYIHFDDWTLLQVNGTTVYVGPYGGDRLEQHCTLPLANGRCLINQIFYTATASGNPELNTSWMKYPNIDILPYLRDGQNTIFSRTIVAGEGEVIMTFRTRMYCTCNDTWNDECAPFRN